MGKKKLSVAIAESSVVEEPQPQQKRKRGRPRKVVEKIEESKTTEGAAEYEDVLEGESKKAETIKGEEEEEKKEELQIEETQVSKLPPRRSSRARRKSKPRKSS
ncbi:Hypothetical predicted protein [Olea europaea subsp. europaea]|uniref:Uncharacterized protein n=1 Tax=Olea europaea subsp. europaea TaxID=158383 RepID=A0A8S0VEE9_OLEEU|nr:Hypothetical predicted protein [Olea europaea subsp. europaea]